jgi:Rieske Fe-S protein
MQRFEDALTEEAGFSRRKLLIGGLLGAFAGLGAALAIPVFSLGPAPGRSLFETSWREGASLAPPDGTPEAVADLPLGGVFTVFPNGDASDPNSATLLIRVEPELLELDPTAAGWAPDGYVAYSKICTHAGCPVGLYRASQHTLICPCHQSEFDVLRGAQPISGPAARPLPQLPIARRADTVRESVELITTGQARRIADQPLQPSRRLAAIIERAMHFDPAERFADMRELAHALAGVRGRRALWPWRSSPEPVHARAVASPLRTKARQAPLKAPEGSGRGLSWALGATVIACSIGAPVWAWWSVRRPRLPAAISVTAPLVSSAAPAAAAAPPESACAPTAPPARADGQSSPPAAATGASDPSSDRAAPGMPNSPAPPTSDPPLPERLASHAESAAAAATEPAVPAPVAQFAATGAVGDGPGEPVAPSELAAPAPEVEGVDPGLAPADGGVIDPQDTLDVTLPRLAAPTIGPERGTNGALIFD